MKRLSMLAAGLLIGATAFQYSNLASGQSEGGWITLLDSTKMGDWNAVVEFARNVAGIADADHAETTPDGSNLVVGRLACSLIGQERDVTAVPGTRMCDLCGDAPFVGFHWCNYGLAPAYADRLAEHGLVIAARADDAGVEAVELPNHPFFLATLFQPQVGSLAGHPLHPVIEAFVAAI